MKSVLVTGGAGYIGSHACKALALAGYRPLAYDNLSRGHAWAVKWGPLERGDVGDASRLREVMARHRPVAVMHFAGLIAAGESVHEPAIYYGNNIAAGVTLLEAVREAGIRHFVFSSSAAVYGEGHEKPIAEAAAHAPVNPYGRTKSFFESVLQDYAAAYGLLPVCLRYFNAAGADPDGEAGECHEPETHLIPRALAAAANGRPLQLFGNDYPTPDGTCIRDYIHVTDLAEAHVRAMEWMIERGGSGVFNVGTGRGHSVREVLDTVERVTGVRVPSELRPRRAGDAAYAVADVSAARTQLGWTASRSDLPFVVETAWKWLRRGRGAASN